MAVHQLLPGNKGDAHLLLLVGGKPDLGSQCWCHLHHLGQLLLGLWKGSQGDPEQKILLGHCDHPGLEEKNEHFKYTAHAKHPAGIDSTASKSWATASPEQLNLPAFEEPP